MQVLTTDPGETDTAIPRTLYVTLLLAMIGPSLSFVTLPPSLPLIADYFGGGMSGREIAQSALACCFLGGTLGGLLSGTIISRLRLRFSLVTASLMYALGGGISMAASAPLTLFSGCFMLGIMGSILSSGLAMATGAVLVGEARSRMLGYQTAVSDVMGIVMGLAAGGLAQLAGWRGPLCIYILFGTVAAVLVTISKPQAIETVEEQGTSGIMAALRMAWPVYLSSILLSVLIGTLQLQLPFHLAANGLDTSASRALVQTFITLAAAVVSLNFGWMRGRLGERAMLILGASGGALGFVGYAIWHGGIYYAIGASIATGMGIGVGVPLVFTCALRQTPPVLHGYSIGILNTTIFLGAAASPLLFNPVATLAGQSAVFILSAILAAGGGGVILFFFRRDDLGRASPSLALNR